MAIEGGGIVWVQAEAFVAVSQRAVSGGVISGNREAENIETGIFLRDQYTLVAGEGVGDCSQYQERSILAQLFGVFLEILHHH